MADLGCLSILTVVGLVGISITQLVFATMGLAHGVPNLKNPPDFTDVCVVDENFEPRMMYIWLVVLGSLVWGSAVLSCIIPGPISEDGKRAPGPLTGLVQLACFCWSIYGCTIVFNNEIFDSLEDCDEFGSHLMRVISLLFVSIFSIVVIMLYLVCFVVCCFGSRLDNGPVVFHTNTVFSNTRTTFPTGFTMTTT